MGAIKTFKTTNWVLVSKASSCSELERVDALGHLFQDYSPALTEFLERFYRFTPDQAAEHVQDFISDRLLAGNLLRQAREKKGRFRTFLLTAIRSYLTDRLRSANSQKRRPPNGFVHLGELWGLDISESERTALAGSIQAALRRIWVVSGSNCEDRNCCG